MADSHRTLRRPDADAGAAEVARYHREVAAALAAIEVDYGEEFVLVPAAAFNTQTAINTEALASEVAEKQLGPFARDSETSRQAALDAYPRQDGQRWKVLHGMPLRGGATRDELEQRTGLSGNTVRPRVQELIDGDFLEETIRTRPTRAGSEAVVLELTHKGRKAIEKEITPCVRPAA